MFDIDFFLQLNERFYKLIMIIESEFKRNFEKKLLLEQSLATDRGYSLPSSTLKDQSREQIIRPPPIINTKINPLKVEQKHKYKNKRLAELKKQIASLDLQKKIRRRSKEKGQTTFDVVDFMNQKINEYNHIVDHNHFHPNNEVSSLKKQVKQEKEIDLIYRNILKTQKKIYQSTHLEEKVKHNEAISKMYHRYSNSMYKKQKKKQSKFVLHSPSLLDSEHSFNFEPQDERPSGFQIKFKQNQSPKVSQEKIQPIKLKEPYIEQSYIKEAKKIDKGIKYNREKLESLRYRMSEILPTQEERKIRSTYSRSSERTEASQYSTNLYLSDSKAFEQSESSKTNQLENYIRKKSPRFTKPSGNKFFLKFDSTHRTKELLNKLPRKSKEEKKNIIQHTPLYRRNFKIPDDLDEEDRKVMQMMVEEEDDVFYWNSMRNQQLDLLLKKSKPKK